VYLSFKEKDMSNILELDVIIASQKVWLARLTTAIENQKVNCYFSEVKDKEKEGVFWAFHGMFDVDDLCGRVVVTGKFGDKTWIAIKESNMFFPQMKDRIWGPDPQDMQTARALSDLIWECCKKELQDELDKDIVNKLPKYQGA
jgi:hypothetical protein